MNNSFLDKKNMIKNMENGRGIKYLLDEAFDILGNPIMMFDTSYNLIMFTDVETDDWIWNEIAAHGTFSQETVDFFNREYFIESFAESETVAFMSSKHLKYERANGKLFDRDNVQLGNISVVACVKPFEDGDMTLIELFCEILSIELQNSEFYKKIDRVYQESYVDRILNGDITDDENVGDMLAELYNGLKENLYLAVVDITQYDNTNTHMAYFRDIFKKLQSEYKYYIHLNNIVIIISTDNEIFCVENELRELCPFFEKYKIYAGISSRFQNIAEAGKYLREAITALHCGLDSKRAQNIFCYDDFRTEHFLCAAVDDMTELFSPVVLIMQRYDSENNTDFLETLYVFMLYGMNVQLACRELDITSDELSRKVKKISDMFNIDFTNGNMLCNIFLSIKLMSVTLNP